MTEYLYETAAVDGATKWHQFWNITIPVLIIFLSLQKYYVAGIASTGAKN